MIEPVPSGRIAASVALAQFKDALAAFRTLVVRLSEIGYERGYSERLDLAYYAAELFSTSLEECCEEFEELDRAFDDAYVIERAKEDEVPEFLGRIDYELEASRQARDAVELAWQRFMSRRTAVLDRGLDRLNNARDWEHREGWRDIVAELRMILDQVVDEGGDALAQADEVLRQAGDVLAGFNMCYPDWAPD